MLDGLNTPSQPIHFCARNRVSTHSHALLAVPLVDAILLLLDALLYCFWGDEHDGLA
jgi:hypothetical protein